MNKINLLFLFFFILLTNAYSQSESIDIQADLEFASTNISSGSETFNIEDLHFHAKRAAEAIGKVIVSLEKSNNCTKALSLASEIAGFMHASIESDDHGDGRISISSAKDLITQAFYEYDVCSIKGNGNEALSELEKQQSNLLQQQKELELKAKQIKLQLAEQKEKESSLKKQKFIDNNKTAIVSNIETFNKQLKACECGVTISDNETENLAALTNKSLAEIRNHYLSKSISLTQRFIDKLNSCKD